jgi:hypothetical protein
MFVHLKRRSNLIIRDVGSGLEGLHSLDSRQPKYLHLVQPFLLFLSSLLEVGFTISVVLEKARLSFS